MSEIREEDAEIITATAASRSFSELLHRVCYGGESFVIKKGNRLMARITPMDTKAETKQIEEAPEPSPLPQTILDALESVPKPEPESITSDEAEFYRAWMEQVRKVEA